MKVVILSKYTKSRIGPPIPKTQTQKKRTKRKCIGRKKSRRKKTTGQGEDRDKEVQQTFQFMKYVTKNKTSINEINLTSLKSFDISKICNDLWIKTFLDLTKMELINLNTCAMYFKVETLSTLISNKIALDILQIIGYESSNDKKSDKTEMSDDEDLDIINNCLDKLIKTRNIQQMMDMTIGVMRNFIHSDEGIDINVSVRHRICEKFKAIILGSSAGEDGNKLMKRINKYGFWSMGTNLTFKQIETDTLLQSNTDISTFMNSDQEQEEHDRYMDPQLYYLENFAHNV